jgi:cystathionine beta-lyase/cystathionine gamma-synthase
MRKRSVETKAAHAGARFPVSPATYPTAMPIYQTSVFTFPDLQTAEAFNRGEPVYQYSRTGHPNGDALAAVYADLEGGEAGLAAASGMGAIFAVLFSLLGPGAHAVVSRETYGTSYASLEQDFRPWGVRVTYVDANDPVAVEAAIEAETRLLYVETLANPTLKVAPLPRLGALCRRRDVLLVVDNTFATPAICRPLEHGADLVLSSATKFLGGHSDLMAGVAAGRANLIERAKAVLARTGATVDPFAAWLTLRGIKTLPLRMARQSANAARLAAFLRSHSGVERVYYPDGDPLLPDGAGAMLAFAVRGGLAEANAVIEALELAAFVPSLGDVTTTVSHPVLTSHKHFAPGARAALGITDSLIRVNAGVESAEEIIADFAQALEKRGGSAPTSEA